MFIRRYRALQLLSMLILLLGFSSCTDRTYTPKPRGYFRIEFPKKQYRSFNTACAFQFDYPTYAEMEQDKGSDAEACWYNLVMERFNGRLHLTYYDINSRQEFENLIEDARTFAFKHTVKAKAIDQRLIAYPERRVYGVYFAIEGNTASSVQFFLTDSVHHYFRGSLYFYERPQYDSIEPVVDFIKKDIDRMIGTFVWKN